MHGTETISWTGLGLGLDPTTTTADISAYQGQQAFPIAADQPVVGSYAWDTTTVPDGQYELRAVFHDASGNVLGQVTRQVLVNNSATRHSGSITANQTWTSDRVHVVEGPVTITAGVTVTIQPGAIVKFDPGAGFDVQAGGELIADGTVAQPIYFTSIHDDSVGGDTNLDGNATSPAAGDWQSIRFESGATGDMDHVYVRYGGNASNSYGAGGEIELFNGPTVSLRDSWISESLKEGILAGGTLNVSNSVVTDNSRGITAYLGGGNVTVTNCTVDSNVLVGLLVHGGTLNVANTLVTNTTQNGVEYDFGTLASLRYSDVWAPSGPNSANYSGMSNQTGQNGNISANPKYKNAAQGDYRLNYLSPAIDAAAGTAAPPTDLMGDPRYNDPRTTTKTGVPDAKGNYPDMGAYEFVEAASSVVDLIVTSVSGPPTAKVGDTVTVTWTDANIGSGSAVGPWHDRVMLVHDPNGEPVDTPLGDVLVGSGVVLGPGQSITSTPSSSCRPASSGTSFLPSPPTPGERCSKGKTWETTGPFPKPRCR